MTGFRSKRKRFFSYFKKWGDLNENRKTRKKLDFAKLAEKAIKAAVAQVVKSHELSGRPMHIWEDGKIVALYVGKQKKRKSK